WLAPTNREVITAMANKAAELDAEFVLKLALYVRDDLNIRSTANFLVAFAANNPKCQPFLKKY
ncbi:MAG: TROVE domain-containing protein, partial [Pseudanabaena sp. RU_4_16]|nr:TROVE domain-containing protein [Pseudanabaena sp. RU_4_16]